MVGLILGYSGAGKTYFLRHWLLDKMMTTNKKVIVVGRPQEWMPFHNNIVIIDKSSDVNLRVGSLFNNTIYIFDSLEFYGDYCKELLSECAKNARVRNNDVFCANIDFTNIPEDYLNNVNTLYYGKLHPCDLEYMVDRFDIYKLVEKDIKLGQIRCLFENM